MESEKPCCGVRVLIHVYSYLNMMMTLYSTHGEPDIFFYYFRGMERVEEVLHEQFHI